VDVYGDTRVDGRRRPDVMPDHAVVTLAQSGDKHATEFLLYKYRSLVRTKTRAYYMVGAETEDLLQVGMIGLWQSIMDYSPARDVSFLSFARICIERHVITAVKTATRRKQSMLNNAVSLDQCIEEIDSDLNLKDVLISETEIDPEEILLCRERGRLVAQALRSMLSEFEWAVLRRYHLGRTYREIADDIDCSVKSVDNALGRIKRKLVGAREVILT